MFRTDLASSFGYGLQTVKFTLTFSDLTTAGTAQTVSLINPQTGTAFQIPQAGKVLGVCVHHTASFTGGSLSAMTVSVGVTGTNTAFTSAFDIFQAAANTTLQETGGLYKATTMAPITVTATFTSTGGNVNTATAGSVDLYISYLNITTPAA